MDKKPWELRESDKREADTLATFIIFCEDESSEPTYFKYFETNKIKVNPIKNQKSKMDNVFNAICHCEDNGLLDSTQTTSIIDEVDTFVWCVFDRDKEENPTNLRQGNTSFNESIITARSKGIKVAWSNDAFELWILLHFEEVDPMDDANKNRKAYYDRLTEILKTMPDPHEDLVKALVHNTFSYKKDLKKERNFRNIIRNKIVASTGIAIERAEALEAHFNKTVGLVASEKAPCTLVHHLVKELLKYGGKEYLPVEEAPEEAT